MGVSAEPVFGQAFAAADVLSPAVRLQIASLLPAIAGRVPVLLPSDLAAAPLPRSREDRLALRAIIERGLGPGVLERLRDARLREVVPAIDGRGDEVEPGPNRARLRNLLERNRASNWAALGNLTLGDIIAWPGVGPSVAATLVGVAVEAGLGRPEDESEAASAFGVSGGAGDDLRLVLDHEARRGDGALRLALERCTEPGVPEPVRAAASRLLSLPAPTHPGLAWLDRAVAAAGDHRDRAVFGHGVLRLADRPTRAEIGNALGVGAERVRQLRARAEDRVAAAAARMPAELVSIRDALAEQLGAAAPVQAADDLFAASGLPVLPDTRSLLLLWLAGPYVPVPDHPGWLAVDPVGVLVETRRVLHEDGGVRPADQVHKELDALGVAEPHVGAWMARQPVQSVDGMLMLTTGTLADVAERALFATGRALTVDELAATAWPGAAGKALERDRLERALHQDGRFLRVGAHEFELTDWGGEPYREAPAGGEASGDRRLWLRIEVDDAVLGGTAAPVPAGLVAALGVRPGARRTFTTRFGPVGLAYDGDLPVHGTLRPVALAAGASRGDVMALGFHLDDDEAEVTLVTPPFREPG